MKSKTKALDWVSIKADFKNRVLPEIDSLNRRSKIKTSINRDFESVVLCFKKLFDVCDISSSSVQAELVTSIFDLYKSREAEGDRAAEKARDEQVRQWSSAVVVIKTAIDYGDEWIGESKDISELLRWIQGGLPKDIEGPLGQLKSSYKERIFQIVNKINESSTVGLTVIFHALNDTLRDLFPDGVRRSYSADAIKKAYQDGKKRIKGTISK